MTNDIPPAVTPPIETRPAGLRQIVAAAFHAVNAAWLSPLLFFLLLAPHQTAGMLTLMLVQNSTPPTAGRPMPVEFIWMAVIGLGSCFWVVVLLIGLPWVASGSTAQFVRYFNPPERRRSFVEDANYWYGRTFVILLLVGLVLLFIYLPIYTYMIWFMSREGLLLNPQPDMEAMLAVNLRPEVLLSTLLYWLIAIGMTVLASLCLAALATDDAGPIQAIRRGLGFVRRRWRDALLFYLVILLLNTPTQIVQQALIRLPIHRSIPLILSVLVAMYTAWVFALTLAMAVRYYYGADRRHLHFDAPRDGMVK